MSLVVACATTTAGKWNGWCQTIVLDNHKLYKHEDCLNRWYALLDK